jgi:hypothetical protein
MAPALNLLVQHNYIAVSAPPEKPSGKGRPKGTAFRVNPNYVLQSPAVEDSSKNIGEIEDIEEGIEVPVAGGDERKTSVPESDSPKRIPFDETPFGKAFKEDAPKRIPENMPPALRKFLYEEGVSETTDARSDSLD